MAMNWQELRRKIREQRLGAADAARLVRTTMGRTTGIIDPKLLVEVLGARLSVLTADQQIPVSGALISALNGKPLDQPIVMVNGGEKETRQRFTVAHELGHLMLHDLGVLYRDERLDGTAPVEREATTFAAELLMPFHEIEALAPVAPEFVAERFGVSISAAQSRLRGMMWIP